MMSADDDPQPLKTVPSKNNLINEAFNLNTNFAGIQPLTVLPPTTNHFQPISHSRTPSMEIKDLKLTALKPPPTNPFQNTQSNTPNSFFDQPTTTPTILAPPAANNNIPFKKTPEATDQSILNTSSPSFNQPSISPIGINSSTPAFNTIPSTTIPPTTQPPTIQPPTIQPLSVVPPPMSSMNSSGSSNPYAAKGALNKKVYNNNIINVAPVTQQQPVDFLKSSSPSQPPLTESLNPSTAPTGMPSLNNSKSAQNLFMPPPPPSGSQTPTQTIQTSQSYNQFPTQPTIGLQQENFNSPIDRQNQQQYNYSTNNNNNNSNGNNANQNGVWNWFSQNKLVNTFVEKAKISVESFVTTVDPQMSNYNHPANRPLYLLSSTSTPKVVHAIREAFNNVGFSKISSNSIDAQNSSQFAPQIIGYPCAMQSAREKIENSLAIMQDSECTVIALQDFLAELSTDCWFELAVIMLKDKKKNIELTVFTEAVPISNEDMYQLQQYTPNDYNLKWSGLACRLPEKNFNFNAISPNSQSAFLSYETQDTMISNTRLTHALQTLANLFKNKMLTQTN